MNWGSLGLGIRWRRGRSYNCLLPSLSVYPVMETFTTDLYLLFCGSHLQDIQQMFVSGKLHPFVREGWSDRSLLHVRYLPLASHDTI